MKQESTPIKTVIIDHDHHTRMQITEALERQPVFQIVASASTGSEGLSQIQHLSPDLVFLETDLSDMSGFDVLHKVSPMVHPQFVMMSSTDKSAIRAFEYFVFDYLLKPIQRSRLDLTMIKVREQQAQVRNVHLHEKLNALFRYINPSVSNELPGSNGRSNLVPVKMSGRIYFIHPDEIEYVEAAGYLSKCSRRTKNTFCYSLLRSLSMCSINGIFYGSIAPLLSTSDISKKSSATAQMNSA